MNKRYSAGAEPNAGTLRLRVPHANGLELTLVVPHLDFYGMLRSHGPGHQLVVTVRGDHWSQFERHTTGLFPALATSRVVFATALAGSDALQVDWFLTTGRRAGISTTTTIDNPRQFSWRSFGSGGAGRGAGRVMDGQGEGVDGAGQPYTWEVSGNRTTVVTQLSSGGSRTAVTTESSWGSNTTWVTKDDSGAPIGTGSYTEDTQSGSWSKSTSAADGSGGTITTTSSGGAGSSSHEKVHTDASGEVVESDRSVTTTGENVSSTVSSSVDGDTGNVTITTTSKDSDGTEYVHVTESDASGNTIRDDTTVTGPGAQPSGGAGNNPGGGGAGGGDGGDGGGGSGNGDSGGQPGSGDPGSGDAGGDPDGGDAGGGDQGGGEPGGGGSGGEDAPDDDDTRPQPGVHPGAGGHDGPHFPGGPLGSVLHGLGVPGDTGGGGDDPNDGSRLPDIIGRRLRQVIVSASAAPSGRDQGDDTSMGSAIVVDIAVPAPPGAVDDWGDRPNPRAMSAFATLFASQAAALSAAVGQLQNLGKSRI